VGFEFGLVDCYGTVILNVYLLSGTEIMVYRQIRIG